MILYVLSAVFFGSKCLDALQVEAYKYLRLGGKAKQLLRTAAVDTMMQLTSDEQERLDTTAVMSCVTVRIEEVVRGAWLEAFALWGSMFQTLTMVVMLGSVTKVWEGTFGSALVSPYSLFAKRKKAERGCSSPQGLIFALGLTIINIMVFACRRKRCTRRYLHVNTRLN